jgi:hypothetical protein
MSAVEVPGCIRSAYSPRVAQSRHAKGRNAQERETSGASALTRQNGKNQMTKMKTLSAAIILSAAIVTPVFAQPTHHGRTDDRHRGAYNQMIGPSYYAVPSSQDERNIEDFGFSGRDRSRPGGWDPNLNPPS